jgi:hypothetical protein
VPNESRFKSGMGTGHIIICYRRVFAEFHTVSGARRLIYVDSLKVLPPYLSAQRDSTMTRDEHSEAATRGQHNLHDLP